jgi:hypothetical protein
MIYELVGNSYIKYEIKDRKDDSTKYIARKKQKDLVKLKKLLFASLSMQDTILLYNSNGSYETFVANFNFKEYPHIPLKFSFYNKKENSYLNITKFPIHDEVYNKDLALDLSCIEEVIIPTDSLENLEQLISQQKFIV